MICPKCQAEMPDGVKFCPACGESVLEAAADVVEDVAKEAEKTENAVEEVVEKVEETAEDIPSASFDPGAPIAVPKKKAEEAVEKVEAAVEEKVPEVAPVESVLPEFPQTDAKPEPIAPPISEPVAPPVEPAAPAVAPMPVAAPAPLTPQTVPAPVSSGSEIKAGKAADEEVGKEYKPLSVGGAFWMLLLFSIPVVGLISAIIFSIAGKKKSRKNLARAVLIWMVIGIILALIAFILIYFLVGELFEAIMGGDINDIIDAVNGLLGN